MDSNADEGFAIIMTHTSPFDNLLTRSHIFRSAYALREWMGMVLELYSRGEQLKKRPGTIYFLANLHICLSDGSAYANSYDKGEAILVGYFC